MGKIKRLFFMMFMLLIVVHAGAQNMAVKDFRLLETDLTANTRGTSRLDQNGETAALIKIVTTEKGFTFEGGSLGIVGSEQKTGEIWLYVPRYAQKLTIKHPLLGVLRDYIYPQTILGGRTYTMELITGTLQTTVKQARTQGYILFKLTPPNAVVELDGELLQTTDGTATIMKRIGTYSYNVKAPTYYPASGRVELKDTKQEVLVELKKRVTYQKHTCGYVLAGAQVGSLMGAGISAGMYLKNFNVEANFVYGFSKSEDIDWHVIQTSSDYGPYSYKPISYGLKLGYGFIVARQRLRLTPQLGLKLVSLNASASDNGYYSVPVTSNYWAKYPSDGGNSSCYVIPASLGLSADFAITRHLGIYVAPEFGFAVKKSNIYSQLCISRKIKSWGTGFNANLGLRYSL